MIENESVSKNNSPLLRGLRILEKVAESSRALTVADLLEELDIPKPTVHRITSQLEEAGYLQYEPSNKRLTVGPKLKSIGFDVLTNRTSAAPRHAILKALSEEIEETCNCAMLDGDHTIYFDRVESDWPYRIDLKIGSHLPLHCTASGKLFLAHMPANQRKKLVMAAPLKQFTERSITDPSQLEEELKRIKRDGIGVDNEEFVPGMVALAIPVFNANNEMCFTVAVHAPAIRKSLALLRQYIPSLRRAAASMSTLYDGIEK
ncbi:MAG: IclR family acetate operon transcriptional repressor [Gammaproteobacteria bacterium]|jgi:IclR family acetate operon transcriptional repressor